MKTTIQLMEESLQRHYGKPVEDGIGNIYESPHAFVDSKDNVHFWAHGAGGVRWYVSGQLGSDIAANCLVNAGSRTVGEIIEPGTYIIGFDGNVHEVSR